MSISHCANWLTTAFVLIAISATLIWLVAGLLTATVMRRHSAAVRHRFWGLSMLAVLVSPMVIAWSPIPHWLQWEAVLGPQVFVAYDTTKPVIDPGVHSPVPGQSDRLKRVQPSDNAKESNPALAKASSPSSVRPDAEAKTTTDAPADVSLSVTATADVAAWQHRLLIAALAWCAGVVVSLSLSVWARWRCARLISRAMPVTDERDVKECLDRCRLLGIRRTVSMGVSTETSIPFVAG